MKSICYKNLSYKQVSIDLLKTWFADKFTVIFSIVCPFIINLVWLLFKNCTILIYEGIFKSLATYVLISTSFCLPIYINRLKTNPWFTSRYGSYINSWKLTYFIAIYSFLYSIVIATIGLVFWIFFLLIIVSSNYYGNGLENIKNWLFGIKLSNWIEIIFYFGYQAILGIAVAFFINCFLSKSEQVYIIASLITIYNFLFIGNLSYGSFLNENGTDNTTNWVFRGFSYLAIYSYTSINGWLTSMAAFSNYGTAAFNFVANQTINVGSNIVTFNFINVLMNFTIPFILISICITICAMKFRWYKGINHNPVDPNVKINQTSKLTYIINFIWIGISTIFVIIGVALLIYINIFFKHNYLSNGQLTQNLSQNVKYVVGSFMLICGIINLSLSAGYLMKNIYSSFQNQIQTQLNFVYSENAKY